MFVDQLGQDAPPCAADYLLNIYVSWETDSPDINYDGGYATIDGGNCAYLVISKNLVDSTESVQGVVSHEIYHDFQFAYDAYWTDSAQWYWEATAEWGAQQVYPESPNPYGFVGALALTQELPLYFFGDAFAQDPTGQHQYGAGLFPRFVSNRLNQPEMVPQSWSTAGQNSDPIDVLGGLLPSGTIEQQITDFYAHNALWDYPQVTLMMGSINNYENAYPTYEQQAHPLILSAGTDGFVDISPNRHLHEHGAHQLVLSVGTTHRVHIQIDGDDAGNAGTPATWTAVVTRTTTDNGTTYTEVPFDGSQGDLLLELPEDEGSVRLTIVVHGDGRNSGETFPYRLSISPDADVGPGADAGVTSPPEDPGPCCSTGGGDKSSIGLTALVGLALIVRRRRSRR
jgi:MYXO-CTERM domain-containing protein